MDQLLKLLEQRSSCRSFKNLDVPNEMLEKIIDTALHTASGGDLQPYSIIAIRDKTKKTELATLCRNQPFIKNAPVLLMLCIDYNRIHNISNIIPFPEIYLEDHFYLWMSVFDVALLSQNLTLVAETKGLKSICIGNYFNYMERVSKLLSLPKYVVPCMLMALGYPRHDDQQPPKYRSKDVLHQEVYRQASLETLIEAYKYKHGDFSVTLNQKQLDLFKENSLRHKNTKAYEYAKQLTVGEDSLDYYQFWLGAFFEPLEGAMTYKDYRRFLKGKGFNWLEDKNET